MRILLFFLAFILTTSFGFAQSGGISGKIVNAYTQEALPFCNVLVKDAEPAIGTSTNMDGIFTLQDVPIGRVSLLISYVGFEPIIIPEIKIVAGSVTPILAELQPSAESLDEVVIKARVIKSQSINKLAMVGSRMLSIEEAQRYAGGFDDPARLASSFAGVSSGIANNAIIVRGNAPKYLQWRLQDIEIPNPNHFANLSVVGGGGITALSSRMIDNSDFLSGAFPASYANAISGVFDLKMREGNRLNPSQTIEIGAIGTDVSAEGALGKEKNGAYLFNYRYSTLSLLKPFLPEEAQGTQYQDLSFKFDVDSKTLGTLSLWGLGLLDQSGVDPLTLTREKVYEQDYEKQNVQQFMGTLGLSQNKRVNNTWSFTNTLNYATTGVDLITEQLESDDSFTDKNAIFGNYAFTTFRSSHKVNHSLLWQSYFGAELRNYSYRIKNQIFQPTLYQQHEEDQLNQGSVFAQTRIKFGDWTLSGGLNGTYVDFSDELVIEPRGGIAYHINEYKSINFGYGFHSRLEPINLYFIRINNQGVNHDLKLTKSHHLALNYTQQFGELGQIKIEPYFQVLVDVPIIKDSTFSVINMDNPWFFQEGLVNDGKGQNLGLDLTFERYFSKGFYYMLAASVSKSRFKNPGMSHWESTRFDRGFVLTVLGGKEIVIREKNTLSLNARLTYQGGERYSSVNEQLSGLETDVVYTQSSPYSQQTNNALIAHFTASYAWKTRFAQEVSIKILNALSHEEFLGHRYNQKTKQVDKYGEVLMFPNVSYKIRF